MIEGDKLTKEQKVQLHFCGHHFFQEVFEVRASRNLAVMGGLEEHRLVEYADRLWYVDKTPTRRKGPQVSGPSKPTNTGPTVTKK